MPPVQVELEDVVRAVTEQLSLNGYSFTAYTEIPYWRKTDISAGIAAAVTVSRQVLAGDVRQVGGWSIRETTGAASAMVRFIEGNAVGGEVICPVGIPQGTTVTVAPTAPGIQVFTGRVFMQVVSGSVEGVIYWR